MSTYKIAAVYGDGIGHEIVPAGLEILQAVARKHQFTLEVEVFEWGAHRYLSAGSFMPEDGLEVLRRFDAVYFGAVGLPEVDDRLPFQLYTYKVRKAFNQYVNYRPVKLLPGVDGPLKFKQAEDIDFVIIRENIEGEFVQNGKIFDADRPHGFATETNLFTRHGIEQVAHYSFQLARKRRKKLTNVTKSNTLIYTLYFWDQVIAEIADQYPDVEYQKLYVDAASASFVLQPERFDVILTTNMIGDILSDLGGATMGSLGLGPSGNINPERNFPSMFEPIHGSAPDIAGQGIANPIGQIWSGALMLEQLGETAAAADIVHAIEQTVGDKILTRDLGGRTTTAEATSILLDHL
ncbi:isocitrate/isopropylmalate dehydrogenase family protein [Flavilitoribacter nigricans]|uniref:Tartrate dehydrogenase n=1 Tax=Flavilitoribacter nigricans (strain ATCC 23147 / DSM 23189 / NBRC 102662 / NCIMB 1420 / SS-2) TaxID=1122177 RepID=A0A2D0N0R8_FLAN2|nr:isocitrate/isopropylmalate family dehydrogenase [Flavilitoribacter nigricans]PHN02121.1 tartrate dehydrogenase [Flavilitoribacter nigricans DSM 23189 = NBRC 102662]